MAGPHRWAPGESGNPKGRPKGSLDKVQKFQIQAQAKADCQILPLDFLLALVRKDIAALTELGVPLDEVDVHLRKAAADSALAYVHRRQPQDVAMAVFEADPQEVFAMSAALSMLSDEELEAATSALRRANEIKASMTYESEPTTP
jgi:hypothetical protein